MTFDDFKQYFDSINNPPVVEKSCKEHKCALSGIKKSKYFVINGDKLEISKNSANRRKTVDCIVVTKKPVNKRGYAVILCELSITEKTIKEIKSKFINSGEDICKEFKRFNLEITEFYCVYIGNIKDKKMRMKEFGTNIIIPYLKIDNVTPTDIFMKHERCGFNIENVYKNSN